MTEREKEESKQANTAEDHSAVSSRGSLQHICPVLIRSSPEDRNRKKRLLNPLSEASDAKARKKGRFKQMNGTMSTLIAPSHYHAFS